MKKLTILLFLGIAIYCSGQSLKPIFPISNIPLAINTPYPALGTISINLLEKSTWINYVDSAARYGGIKYQGFRQPLFFDSTVQQIYGNGSGGFLLSNIHVHSMGQIFDPKSMYFNYDSFDYSTIPYKLDSIAFPYTYHYNFSGSVDTLLIQYFEEFNNDSMPNGSIYGGSFSPSLSFETILMDPATFMGYKPIKTVTILLTNKDTSTAFKLMQAPAGIHVFGGGTIGFTATFKAGYKYNLNDTLDDAWPGVRKKLNIFSTLFEQDASKKNIDTSFNSNITLVSNVRYNVNPGSFKNTFIPGKAWNAGFQHLFSFFKISPFDTSVISGINTQQPITTINLGNVYPNPSIKGVSSSLEFSNAKAENVTIEIYNILGERLYTIANGDYSKGIHKISFSTESLNPGVYFYTINSSGFTQTKKFVVAE